MAPSARGEPVKVLITTLALAFLAASSAACGGGSSEPSPQAPRRLNFEFDEGMCPVQMPRFDLEVGRPVELQVTAGDALAGHTLALRVPASGVESTHPMEKGHPLIQKHPVSIELGPGEVGTLSFTPTETGEFRSECTVTGSLNLSQGTIEVRE